MNTAESALVTKQPRALSVILWAGLVSGTLDITAALIVYARFGEGSEASIDDEGGGNIESAAHQACPKDHRQGAWLLRDQRRFSRVHGSDPGTFEDAPSQDVTLPGCSSPTFGQSGAELGGDDGLSTSRRWRREIALRICDCGFADW